MTRTFGLPDRVQFCKRCVISNQRPSSSIEFKSKSTTPKHTIDFDSEGICSACRFAEIKSTNIDWNQREQELLELCAKHRGRYGKYDVIVPGSGGKDSAFTSHVLKYKYGMNPLTVTWAPHLYTQIGFQNFTNWIHVGGFDNILFTPNGRLHRLLTKLAFVNLLHPFQPFIIGQRIIGPLMALRFGVPFVMYGENQAEYGNNITDNYNSIMSPDFFGVESSDEIFIGGMSIQDIIGHYGFTENDFAPYIPPSKSEIESSNIEVHYLGYYLHWDPQECYYYAVENTGFSANPERTQGTYSKYSSIDDKIDFFHYYTTLIKFGLGRASYDASQEVRNGKITRAEAIHLVNKYDSEFPEKYFADFLDYITLDKAQFHSICDSFRPEHIWSNDSGTWHLKHTLT
jgi:N-acetyl sugar amidotransferase